MNFSRERNFAALSTGVRHLGRLVRVSVALCSFLLLLQPPLFAAENDTAAAPQFTPPRGFHPAPIIVTLSGAPPGASIYFTTNGSVPSATNGTRYTSPISLDRTTPLRAVTFAPGREPSPVMTHTYLFLDDLLTQTGEGFPARWGAVPADYEMDPQVVNDPAYRRPIRQGMQSIPTLSIVMDPVDLFGPRGLYSDPMQKGREWERGVSIEFIAPANQPGFQINCGLRMQGRTGRDPEMSPKHSFRVLFKDKYGASKLRFPLFADSAVSNFDTLTLRAGFNNTWHWQVAEQRERAQLIHDQWARDTQLAMGQPASHGRFVHVCLNGLYWGVYNLIERPSAPFCAAHLGGKKSEWDVLNAGRAVDGDTNAWTAMMNVVNRNLADPAVYRAAAELVDVPNLIDYMLLNFYGGNNDWDYNNWYAARRRAPGAKWLFFSWDAERILESPEGHNLTGVNLEDKPSRIYHQFCASPEFRLLFADRVQRHLFNGGALTPAAAAARWMNRAAEIDYAIIGESARWGDAWRKPAYTRNVEWLAEQNRLLGEHFPRRGIVLLDALRAAGLYPRLDAPLFIPPGGRLPPGQPLTLTNRLGKIYYTTDGTDPRVPFTGALARQALLYTNGSPLHLDHPAVLQARSLLLTNWSALNRAAFEIRE